VSAVQNQVSLAGLDVLAGIPAPTRVRLAPRLLVTPMTAGQIVAHENRPTDYAYVILEGSLRAHRGWDERTGALWGRGATLGVWKKRGLLSPATFSVAKSGSALVAPMAVIERMRLGDDYSRYAALPRPADFSRTKLPPNDFLIINSFLGRSRFESALDIGAGQGTLSKVLHWSAKKVTLLDPDPAALKEAKRILTFVGGGPWFKLRVGEAQKLDFRAGSFDLVATRLAVHHVPDLDAMLAEVHRCLRPGGTLLVSDLIAPRSGVDLLNALETAVDSTHHLVRSQAVVEEALQRAGFSVDRIAVTRRRADVDARPYADTANGRCAKILRRASEADRRAIGVFKNKAGQWGWVDHRLVLLARKTRRSAR
jgi:ubiquinone/menaquinone biosynthesis C-methylase UbiE